MMRMLDLFCGAGGASAGYARAGWEVTGADIAPQPNYPFKFLEFDATKIRPEVVARNFDAIHASPPCQAYSGMSACRPGLSARYPELVEPIRELLTATGLPWVIENVVGSPLKNPIMLCGHMFGLDLYRHRLFETSFPIAQPEHPVHERSTMKAGRWRPGTIMSVVGHCAPVAEARRAMGINWMSRDELVEAIPPAYTEYVAGFIPVG